MPIILSHSGLRGIALADLTPEMVTRVATAFGRFIGGGKIGVGRDARSTSELFYHSTCAGLLAAGCEVINFGIVPTPTVVLNVRELNLAGGVVITASHNPFEWNGLKFINREGKFLSLKEFSEFKQIIKRRPAMSQEPRAISGVRDEPTAVTNHIKKILNSQFFRDKKFKEFSIGVDGCDGPATSAACSLIETFGSTPVSLASDLKEVGFPRPPEPEAKNLERLSGLIRKKKLDFGIAFDPDGDRFSCVDEEGKPLGEELTIVLAGEYILQKRPGPVVVNLSTTRAVDLLGKRYNVPVYRTKIGEVNVIQKMEEVGAVLGGEGNGGVILPEINLTRDGLIATAILIGLISERERPLSQIVRKFPNYSMRKTTISLGKKEFKKKLEKVIKAFNNAEFVKLDGLKILDRNFWLHIRPSNTEPVIRIIAESESEEYTCELISRVKEILTG